MPIKYDENNIGKYSGGFYHPYRKYSSFLDFFLRIFAAISITGVAATIGYGASIIVTTFATYVGVIVVVIVILVPFFIL